MATLMDTMAAPDPGLLVSPGSHTTAEFPRTPALDGPLATVNGKDGDVEREIQAMLAQQQQPTAPQLRAVSPPGPRTRHHPYANYAVLAGEDDRSESGSPGPQRRTRKASSRVASRKASTGARGRSTPRYNEDDTGSEYEPEGGAHEDEGSEFELDAADVEDEPLMPAAPRHYQHQPAPQHQQPMMSMGDAQYQAQYQAQQQHLAQMQANGGYHGSNGNPGQFSLPDMPVPAPSTSGGGGRKAAKAAPGEVRLTATGKPSHARKTPPGHIKRPRNAFILFRSHACVNNLIPTQLGITDHRHVSRIVGNLWRSLPPEEKRIWEQQAELEKEEHKRLHPDYKYRPVYRREGVVRRRRRKANEEKDIEEEERKCEVVARVLLEGGDVTEERVEQELEVQRERDEIEGRVRGPASRSPSRSQSTPFYGYDNGPPQQPQYAHPGLSDPNYGYGHPSRYGSMPESIHLQPPQHYVQSGGWPTDGRSHSQPLYDMHAPGGGGPIFDHGDPDMMVDRRSMPPVAALSLQPPGTSPSLLGPPATPRTMAMQQHAMQLQARIRGNSGTGSQSGSPRTTSFSAMRSGANVPAFSSGDAMLVSPTRGGPHDGPHATTAGPTDQQPYSALGELAAGGADGGGYTLPADMQQEVSYEPDQGVQYIYLDAEQAQDAALVESIRQQGFGVSFASAAA